MLQKQAQPEYGIQEQEKIRIGEYGVGKRFQITRNIDDTNERDTFMTSNRA